MQYCVRIANSVLTKGAHAYGDQHPRFGYSNSEVDTALLVRLLRKLFSTGYLGEGKRSMAAFEVKPREGEDSK